MALSSSSCFLLAAILPALVAGTGYFYPQRPSYYSPYSPSPRLAPLSSPFGYFGSSAASPYSSPVLARPSVARVKLVPGGDSGVTGELWMKQTPHAVMITGLVKGLAKGKHGFHIHMTGDVGDDCKAAGGHFNPKETSHGDPHSHARHAGDLGNIVTYSEQLPTEVFIFDRLISLSDGELDDVTGRAVVVHAGEDDLGRGRDEESLKTGNAGARVACGVIEKIEY